MNEYLTPEILLELEEIEKEANHNWKVAHEAERPVEVDTDKPLPAWFKR